MAESVEAEDGNLTVRAEKAGKETYLLLEEEGEVLLTPDMYEFDPADGVTYSIIPEYSIGDHLSYKDGRLSMKTALATLR